MKSEETRSRQHLPGENGQERERKALCVIRKEREGGRGRNVILSWNVSNCESGGGPNAEATVQSEGSNWQSKGG